MKKAAINLSPGNTLLGVLSGKPWRVIRDVTSVTNWDVAFEDGRAILIDAVPVKNPLADFYQPIEVWAGATIEVVG